MSIIFFVWDRGRGAEILITDWGNGDWAGGPEYAGAARTANSTNLLIMRRRRRDTFAIKNRLGAPAFGYCSHRQMPIWFSFQRVS